jgi:hypothetical protein
MIKYKQLSYFLTFINISIFDIAYFTAICIKKIIFCG